MEPTIVTAVTQSLGSGLVPGNQIDNLRAVAALRAGKTLAEHAALMEAVMAAREQHRRWLTITQREWQIKQRHISPRTCAIRKARWGNKHSDEAIMRAERASVRAREMYVRCGQ